MTIILKTIRVALPVLLFGYGTVASLSMLAAPQPAFGLPADGLLSGGLTRDIDGIYKKNLPHMDLSFGLIGAARYALLGEAREGAIVGQDGWLFSAEELRSQPSDAELASAVATVAEVRDRLSAAGVDLVVVPLPAKIDIYHDRSPDPVFGQDLAALLAGFAAQLAGEGIMVVDARSALLSPNPVVPVFFATDTHWSPAGAELVAGAVAASGLVAQGSSDFTRADTATKPLAGDLVRFVTTSALAPRLGLASETLVPFVLTPTGDAGDIFSAAPADVVLVGTSYSANSDWGFAEFLMLALHRDVLNMAAEGQGPLQPMRDYLASDLMRDAPPAVVIWEIPVRYLTDPAMWNATGVAPDEIATLPYGGHADG
ncbi:hypothetical protein [Frigidibacter sp.]|uniref:alginate O-acetyltransferase AlgX-related protein n=1 Tax=Frigidibacter sp. TaxID=2586418 RepID=UPI0027336E85|nr:hypothetical protein [Frigidibacter sp.]MDP3342288.1 hypothetical protein [Frigidibacter sp.]